MYERLEVASVKKILIFSKHLYCNRFLRQSQTETTRPTKNHFLVGLILLYWFYIIINLPTPHLSNSLHLLGCRDMGDKGHYAD